MDKYMNLTSKDKFQQLQMKLIVAGNHQQNNRQDSLGNRDQPSYHFESYGAYILSIIGFSVGFGSFWRFPYLIYKNGGGVFFIPYFIGIIVVAIPMIYLETALGQMHQKSIPFIFSSINKGLKMFGTLCLFVVFNASGYYNLILAWCYRYIFTAFQNPLPFSNQSPSSNAYFNEIILHKSNSLEGQFKINFVLLLFYIFSMGLCYIITKDGVKISTKVVSVTAVFPYFFFILLVFQGIFLEGADVGLKYLFNPKWQKLFQPSIWVDAATQIFFQMNIAIGGIINYSSLKPKGQNIIEGIFITMAAIILCGLLCALSIFMYLGHFSHINSLNIHQLNLSGGQLSFNVFPKALSILPWPNFFIFFFFISMVTLGIDTMFGNLETIYIYFQNQFEKNIQIFGRKITLKQAKLFIPLAILVFCPLLCSTQGVFYLIYFDDFACNIPLAAVALIELYTFVYLFPFSELQKQLNQQKMFTPLWIQSLIKSKVLIVFLIINCILAFMNQIMRVKFYSLKLYLFGWIITLYPFGFAFIYWILYREQKFKLSFQAIRQQK